jgi:hypothetical protein
MTSSGVSRWLNFQAKSPSNKPTKLTKAPSLPSEHTFVSFVSAPPGHFSPVRDPNAYGPGKPSPENAKRPIEVRLRQARELLGELDRFYNTRVTILEALAGLAREEAERRALSEVKASDIYRRWRALG